MTGCLGFKKDLVRKAHPSVLAITGPHDTPGVMKAVHAHLPKPHDPFTDLVPPQGIKLTPNHYAYLKISEGCNHRCTFCIIPSMRGDLVSRPIGEVMQEAENLVRAGVKELLVISQDTSAYGVDVKYRTGFHGGKPVKTNFQQLCRSLGELGVWVRLHYVYPYPHVDDVIPLMADGKILPYLDIPFQHASPRILKLMKRPAAAEKVLARIRAWRKACPDITIRSTFIAGFPGRDRGGIRGAFDLPQRGAAGPRGMLRLFAGGRREGERAAGPGARRSEGRTAQALHGAAGAASAATKLKAKIGRTLKVIVDAPGHRPLHGGCAGNRRLGLL